MEPRPRGLTIIDRDPDWVRDAKTRYHRQEDSNLIRYTDLWRAGESIRLLDQRVLPGLDHSPRILLVGLGLGEYPVPSTWTPYFIAGHLEGKGIDDYHMTLVDIDPHIIEGIKTRMELHLPVYPRGHSADPDYAVKYIADTGQEPRFIPLGDAQFSIKDRFGLAGIRVVRIPKVLQQKLENSDIGLIAEDISIADLGDEPFDFIECLNVLYQLNDHGRLAITNMARSLQGGGYLFINDIDHNIIHAPDVSSNGWLIAPHLEDLRLEIVKEIGSSSSAFVHGDAPSGPSWLFRKYAQPVSSEAFRIQTTDTP